MAQLSSPPAPADKGGTPPPPVPPRRGSSPFRAVSGQVRGRHWTLVVGATVLVLILLVLLLTPWIAPSDPSEQDLTQRLVGPSSAHWLGTDHLGRDTLSRLMWGGRFSVTIAAITLVLCVVIGGVVGALAARKGGWLDEVTMRTVDVLVCFPDVIIALFLITIFGTGYVTLIVALTVTGWTPFARLMRGLALEINSKEFVEAAEILGSPKAYIIFRHVIPNAMRPMAAVSFLRFGHKLITVGGLSYLGLGVQPPDSDWGAMLLDAQPYMERAPWAGILPGAAIFITALSVTMIGQGIDMKRKKAKRADAEEPEEEPLAEIPQGASL
jgi:ABC-type dipeptide/oligopeptide/nickel transport system permease subunit